MEEKDNLVPDEAVSKCISCAADFGVSVQGDHCRNCLEKEKNCKASTSSHCIPETEKLQIYLSDRDYCIKCNGGGRLLVCSDLNCPIAFHKECMPQTLSINSIDNFYCPFCSYKQALTGTSKTKQNVRLAKKNLLLFIGKNSPNTNSQMQKAPEGASRPIILGEMTCDETAKHLNADRPIVHSGQLENDQEVERSSQVIEKQETGEGFDAKPDDGGHQIERAIQFDEQQEADDPNIPHVEDQTQLKSSADSSSKRKCDEAGDKRPEMQEHDLEPASILRKRKLTSPDEGNIKEKDGTADTLKEKQKPSAGGEKSSVEHKDKAPSSRKTGSRNVAVKTRSRTVEHKEEVEASEVPSMAERLTIRERSLNVEHKEKTTTSTSTVSKPHLFLREKRRKCLWRVEEEEMLKLGVDKFSTKINKNIPWKKLLEFGREVFDNSRNPRDLKDKWRNMQGKEQPPPPSPPGK